MKLCAVLGVAVAVAVLARGTIAAAGDQDCKFWKTLALNISRAADVTNGMLRMACNSTCSDVMCSGHVNNTVGIPGLNLPLDLDFCYGIRLNHCDKPVSMNYYMEVPSKNLSVKGVITHNDSFEFPAYQWKGTDEKVVVFVEMVKVNSSFVLFGITGKLKVTVAGFTELWPYSEVIFPPTYIDVPPCLDRNTTRPPFQHQGKCMAPKVMPHTRTTTQSPVIVIKSDTYNKSCELGLGKCGPHEMCKVLGDGSRSKNGICVCEIKAVLSPATGFCEPLLAPTTALPPRPTVTTKIPIPSVTSSSKASSGGIKMTPVIIGSVAGGLLLIVVCVSVLICLGRRRRQAIYRDRQQLLTDDLDADDVNVVV